MKKSIQPYLQLILIAIEQLDEYVPATQKEFLSSRVLQDAILLQLFQIGENLARIRDISPEVLETAPESWNRIIGLRNLVAHEYRKIDPDIIWKYLGQDLTEFKISIDDLIE